MNTVGHPFFFIFIFCAPFVAAASDFDMSYTFGKDTQLHVYSKLITFRVEQNSEIRRGAIADVIHDNSLTDLIIKSIQSSKLTVGNHEAAAFIAHLRTNSGDASTLIALEYHTNNGSIVYSVGQPDYGFAYYDARSNGKYIILLFRNNPLCFYIMIDIATGKATEPCLIKGVYGDKQFITSDDYWAEARLLIFKDAGVHVAFTTRGDKKTVKTIQIDPDDLKRDILSLEKQVKELK